MSRSDWLALVKQKRGIDLVQQNGGDNVVGVLADIAVFLQARETPKTQSHTHIVFDNYKDWWTNNNPTFHLAMAEDNTLDKLYEHIVKAYDLGIPLTLSEKPSSVISLFQDIEIWGTPDTSMSVSEVVDEQAAFMKILGKTMGQIYPDKKFLDCCVFDASGLSKSKAIRKLSVRVVWPAIFVDKQRAQTIRDYLVYKLKNDHSPGIASFEASVQSYNKQNHWSSILSDVVYSARSGVRMPFCDRVSPIPFQKPEDRPFKPLRVVRFSYRDGELQAINLLQQDIPAKDWLRLGCIRQDEGKQPTEWKVPTWAGSTLLKPGSVRADKPIKMRTHGGSDGDRRRPPARGVEQCAEDVHRNVKRELTCNMADFKQHLSKQGFSVVANTDGLVWQPRNASGTAVSSGAARLVMDPSCHFINVTGTTHQVRCILQILGHFTRPVGNVEASCNGYSGGSKPSPSAVYAPCLPAGGNDKSNTALQCAAQQLDHVWHVSIADFVSEGDGELALKKGDLVKLILDPDQANDGWVFGVNQSSQGKGYFPLSFIQKAEDAEANQGRSGTPGQ